jgi:hypothetical protein
VFNWRIVLGGAASAAILTAGVAAPAFAASTPVPLNGITQGLSTSQAGGIFCALPNMPVSLGVTAAAGAIGESCDSTQVSSSSQSIVTPQQASAPQAGRQGASQDIGLSSGQANGPARTASAPQAAGSSCALPNMPVSLGVTAAAGAIGVTGGLSGSQNGGPATGPLP